ncbi:MAG: hypothetical protein GY950_00660 [bacterium]|nr:hypothetical protein [bacterium]
MKETILKKMSGNKHGRKYGLRLNKRTIAHLNHRQMAQVDGGYNAGNDCSSVLHCKPGDTQQGCQAETTRDTGIPPGVVGETDPG